VSVVTFLSISQVVSVLIGYRSSAWTSSITFADALVLDIGSSALLSSPYYLNRALPLRQPINGIPRRFL
jgi:hypothetical protein